MTVPSFAERTKISSILRESLQGDGVEEEEKSVPMTSSLVTENPPCGVPDPLPTLEGRLEHLALRLGRDVESAKMYARIVDKELLIQSTNLALGQDLSRYRGIFN